MATMGLSLVFDKLPYDEIKQLNKKYEYTKQKKASFGEIFQIYTKYLLIIMLLATLGMIYQKR